MKLAEPARIHLIPAKNVPLTLVIRRKPSRVFSVFLWNTKSNHLECGSRFTGKLYVEDCDISFDGKWMTYEAIGADGNSWSGLCKPPYLKTLAEGNHAPGIGGGVWLSETQLCVGHWRIPKGTCPYQLKDFQEVPEVYEDVRCGVGFLLTRLRRDGWRRVDGFLKTRKTYGRNELVTDRWYSQPGNKFPKLCITIEKEKRQYTFQLDGYDDLVDDEVSWATWDSEGNLIFSRLGILYRFDLKSIHKKKPTYELDLENHGKGAGDA